MPRLKITNRLGLPLPIVEAVTNDEYDAGRSDYTATSLLQPVRMRRLVQMYPDECVEDVSEVLYRLHGKAVHMILERNAEMLEAHGLVVERRFYGAFVSGGRTFLVSAAIDLYDPKEQKLSDYKSTSVYALSQGVKEEHRLQMNLQRYLMLNGSLNPDDLSTAAGLTVKAAEIVGLFRDWNADRAEERADYPQAPAVRQDVPFMPEGAVETWVVARIAAHETVRLATTQAELPLCTDDETWARTEDDGVAVRREGNIRPSKVCATLAEAEAYVAQYPDRKFTLEPRLGKAVRCQRYCPARRVCAQWSSSPRNPANQGGSLAIVEGQVGTKRRSKRAPIAGLPDDME